jgi:hypothetical protein
MPVESRTRGKDWTRAPTSASGGLSEVKAPKGWQQQESGGGQQMVLDGNHQSGDGEVIDQQAKFRLQIQEGQHKKD